MNKCFVVISNVGQGGADGVSPTLTANVLVLDSSSTVLESQAIALTLSADQGAQQVRESLRDQVESTFGPNFGPLDVELL